MESAKKMKSSISRQLSASATTATDKLNSSGIWRHLSFNLRHPTITRNAARFALGRQSSLDPNPRDQPTNDGGGGGDGSSNSSRMTVPDNLDNTMQLLFMAHRGDVSGVEELIKDGVDVNSIDLDGRTALHIAACEGQVEVVRLLLNWKANINARDRWGSTPAADAKFYGKFEVYSLLRSRGAKAPKTRKTPMAVSNPKDVPEYEINPLELEFRRGEHLKGEHVAKWNGIKVFVKILDKENQSDQESIDAFNQELTLLEKVRHPNLVQFVGAVTQNAPLMIVTEYHPQGDLASYLQKKVRLKPHKALRFALDIARALNYLHESKPDPIIHCNLNPKNIFRDDEGKLKVAGSGSIAMIKVSAEEFKLARPMAHLDSVYMAPEVYKNQILGTSVDIFAFALLLYEMIEGTAAFHPNPPEEAAKMICVEGMRPPFKNKPKSYPADLKELIEECWDPRSAVRPTFAEIIPRLNNILASCAQQSRWKHNFKLPWKQGGR